MNLAGLIANPDCRRWLVELYGKNPELAAALLEMLLYEGATYMGDVVSVVQPEQQPQVRQQEHKQGVLW